MTLSSPLTEEDWTKLTHTLEAFAAAWESSPYPPLLADFLPVPGSGMRKELVPELIKLDLEQRWQRGLRKIVEDYSYDVPELDVLVTVDLVFEEYHIRKTAGDHVSPTEFFKRFPALACELDGLFRLDPALRSTFLSDDAPAATIDLRYAAKKDRSFTVKLSHTILPGLSTAAQTKAWVAWPWSVVMLGIGYQT